MGLGTTNVVPFAVRAYITAAHRFTANVLCESGDNYREIAQRHFFGHSTIRCFLFSACSDCGALVAIRVYRWLAANDSNH
jgi:hypothetical protein